MFAQIVECEVSDLDALKRLEREWEESTTGERTARRMMLCRDRDRPDHFFEFVFFDSYESAMQNSRLPGTQRYAEQMSELLGHEPAFHNLEVVEERHLS
jgi:quinol monooxygenase YgiN